MIKITFFIDGFIVNGHAYFDEKGKDIVCAAISGICFGSINWFNQKDIIIFNQDLKIPELKLKVKLNQKNQIALSLIQTQIKSICNAYELYCQYVIYQKELE